MVGADEANAALSVVVPAPPVPIPVPVVVVANPTPTVPPAGDLVDRIDRLDCRPDAGLAERDRAGTRRYQRTRRHNRDSGCRRESKLTHQFLLREFATARTDQAS